jgi:hypothetical protein
MNSELKEDMSSSSESSSPVKVIETETKPLAEKQQNEKKSLENGVGSDFSNVASNLVDLKSEFNFIKNKIIQIESETRDILRFQTFLI